MKLWDYLKMHMEFHKDKIAFHNSNISYNDLLTLDTSNNDKKIVIINENTKEGQALNILRNIALGNVIVPISKTISISHYEHINNLISNNQEDISDLSFIMFTSGTTGLPKGVMLTDDNIISNLEYIKTYFDVSGSKTICIFRPLVHISAVTGELLYALINGLTIYFYEEQFIPKRLLKYMDDNNIDILGATPTIFNELSKAITSKLNLKIGVISGEILPKNVALFISSKFPNTLFYNGYGLTEHSPRALALLPNDFNKKIGSVGKPIGDVKIKIVNNELLIKSSSVMKGYFNDKKLTETKIKNGWLHTGDIASIDEDGYFYIHGRVDEMIIKAGINIYPQEIEVAVNSISGVTDSLAYAKIIDGKTILYLDYIGDIDIKYLRIEMMKVLNPNIVPNKIQKVDFIPKTISGKKVRK